MNLGTTELVCLVPLLESLSTKINVPLRKLLRTKTVTDS